MGVRKKINQSSCSSFYDGKVEEAPVKSLATTIWWESSWTTAKELDPPRGEDSYWLLRWSKPHASQLFGMMEHFSVSHVVLEVDSPTKFTIAQHMLVPSSPICLQCQALFALDHSDDHRQLSKDLSHIASFIPQLWHIIDTRPEITWNPLKLLHL